MKSTSIIKDKKKVKSFLLRRERREEITNKLL